MHLRVHDLDNRVYGFGPFDVGVDIILKQEFVKYKSHPH